jgi:glutamine cyclotransferase
VVFESAEETSRFLDNPQFDFASLSESYAYEITYSDGTTFERDVSTLDQLRELHRRIERLVGHVNGLN